MSRKKKIDIPKGFMNIGVTISNYLIGDTNDSANWDTFEYPLPKPMNKWNIHSYENDGRTVVLIDKH